MRRSALHAVLAVAACATLAAPRVGASSKPTAVRTLDRAVFEVELFNENGRSSGFDSFVFADGKLATSEMRNLGCWASDVTIKPARGDAIQFEVSFTTPEGQSIRVRGVVKDNTLEGSILWPESEDAALWTYTGRRVQGLLDGSRFDIEIVPEDDMGSYDEGEDAEEDAEGAEESATYALLAELEHGSDQLVFDRGGFVSRAARAAGLPMTSYAAERYEDTITFAARTASATSGLVEWTGNVEGDRIEGTLQWTTPEGNVVHYAFSGKRVTG